MARRRPNRFAVIARPSGERMRRSGAAVASLVLLAVSIWMLTNIISQVVAGFQLNRQYEQVAAEVAAIEAANADLKKEVEIAESPAYAEQVAREQLGMAREGDTVILPTIPDVAAPTPTPPPAPLPTPTPQPNWRGWQQALFP
ncbi:MAG: hypothetical protein Fur005_35450 [Roseiflexaceae bacterium]